MRVPPTAACLIQCTTTNLHLATTGKTGRLTLKAGQCPGASSPATAIQKRMEPGCVGLLEVHKIVQYHVRSTTVLVASIILVDPTLAPSRPNAVGKFNMLSFQDARSSNYFLNCS